MSGNGEAIDLNIQIFKPYIMSENQNWYAVYTRPRWEKKVSELLGRKKIENYCPLNQVVRQWSDRKKIVEEPLFNSYVFIKITPSEQAAVKQTDGVVNFVYWLGKPAVIKDNEIDMIKKFLFQYQNITLEKISVNVHDRVRVSNGPFTHLEGDVLEVKSKVVKVYLPSLGYAMIAEVEIENVEVLTRDTMIGSINNSHYNSNAAFSAVYR